MPRRRSRADAAQALWRCPQGMAGHAPAGWCAPKILQTLKAGKGSKSAINLAATQAAQKMPTATLAALTPKTT